MEFLFHLPLVGEWIQSSFLQRWTALMASLLKNGFTVPEALHLSVQMFGESRLSQELSEIERQIIAGKSFSQAAAECSMLPVMISELYLYKK